MTTTLAPHTSVTQALGLYGWDDLDPAILAALAIQAPVLLIGPHGLGKTQLAEAVSEALRLSYRHYNASLINYDDLVGIPMPNEDGTALNFIKSTGSIWGAEFVFLDEISRCRPDLQNKLYPIIHERRVLGIQLDELAHRWAAMNPPAPDDLNAAAQSDTYYLGSEPLDPALTDRFPFILPVPTWSQLSVADRLKIVNWRSPEPIPPPDLPAMVAQAAALIPEVEATFHDWLGDYTVCLVDLLEKNGLPQSPRRARMLARSVVAVHAARLVIGGEDVDPADSAEIAVRYGLPQTATDTPPAVVKVVALHKQAWELSQYMENDNWRRVFDEQNPARSIMLAHQLGFDDEELSRLITHTLSTEDSDLRQIGLATGIFLKFSQERNLDPSAFEPLAQLAYHILEPSYREFTLSPDTDELKLWDEIKRWIYAQKDRETSPLFRLQRNFLLYSFPEAWQKTSWSDALQQFTQDLTTFGIRDHDASDD